MFLIVVFVSACQYETAKPSESFNRIALVIGNQHYTNNVLDNPINDAKAVQERLKSIGFEVILQTDVTLTQFYQALEKIREKIKINQSIFFFYFAGHGNTLSKNSTEEYLMMTDKDKKVLVSIYRLYNFLDQVKARHNIVVIDACRNYQSHYLPLPSENNHPYIHLARNFRGNFTQARGEKKVEFVVHDDNVSEHFPASTIVSYSTSHNQMARDWSLTDIKHSPYTKQLIKHLGDEEIPIWELFRRVRAELIAETNNTQRNIEESSLEKNVWLVPKESRVAFSPPI